MMNDERLTAFLDGELGEDEERALRRELAGEPALADDLAQLGAVRAEIELAARALRDRPLASDQRARLRAGLASKLAAEQAEAGEVEGGVVLRFARRAAVPVAAALAAGLALYLATPRDHEATRPARQVGLETPAPEIADADVVPAIGAAVEVDVDLAPREEPVVALEAAPADATPGPGAAPPPPVVPVEVERIREPQLAAAPAPRAEASEGTAPASEPSAPVELEGIAPEDLAIALDYELLADYDVIEQLDLLEMMLDFDEQELLQ